MTDFVHLHLHTEYSLLDGAVRLATKEVNPKNLEKPIKRAPLAEKLIEFGMDACAITDHGNMYGVYNFVNGFREKNLKPIIGQEFYVADDMYAKTANVLKQRYHLILIAKNGVGYKNLMWLSSAAFTDGFYMKPRVDLKRISEHSEGLICLSACLAGQVPQLLLQGDYENAKKCAEKMREMFAPGDFYIELQDHGLPEDKIVLNSLVGIAKEIGVKVVATNDVHYLEREDADTQDTMMCITMGIKKSDDNAARFSVDEFYLKSGDEMAQLFSWCPEAIETTREIADKCEDIFLEKVPDIDKNTGLQKIGEPKPLLDENKNPVLDEVSGEPVMQPGEPLFKKVERGYFIGDTKNHPGVKQPYYIPHYTNDEVNGRTSKEYIHDLAYDNIGKRYDVITDEITERLNHELQVIDECGFNDYFLVVWDYVRAARDMGIPVGPGRGSGVGSLVAYSIGITDVDPLRFDLLFERFLSKERVTLPDFDVDFCFVRRPEVVEYCVKKYGKENVAQIIAYSTMSAKAVVKDVARVFDVPYAESNAWVKTIPGGKVHLAECFLPESGCYSADFVKLYEENPSAKKIIDVAMKLEGMPRQTSMHAAGVVIASEPIVEHVALSRNGQDITTQFDKNVVENIGLVKMDFLGLKTLTDISEAINYVKEDKGIDIDFHTLGYDDPKVYEMISSGDCEAVFQLENGGMRNFMTQLQPDKLEDLIAGISLYRPGPMDFIPPFLEGRKHPELVKYKHPLLEPILKDTYGCIVYQEQVMKIASSLAGFTTGAADILRRIISKKKKEDMAVATEVFLNGGVLSGDLTKTYLPGALANGVSKEVVEELLKQIEQFAEYAFNKSHAAAYAYLSYQTAYLKCYFPTHFLTAVVNNRISNADETKHYINYMKRTGIKILPPDINRSKKHFSIDGNDVRYGLMGIKNVGEQAMEYLLNERKNGEFKDIRDLLERCQGQINKRMLESLIKGGALDSFGKTRSTLMASYERIMDAAQRDKKSRETGQISLFDIMPIEDVSITYYECKEYDKPVILEYEKEVLGMYVSGHPLDDYVGDFGFDTTKLYVEEANSVNEDDIPDFVPGLNLDLDQTVVSFGCIVSSFEKKVSKRDKRQFVVGTLEDRFGSIGFSMYPGAFEKYGDIITAEVPVKVRGKLDFANESEPKISVEKVERWIQSDGIAESGAVKGQQAPQGTLFVLLSSSDELNLVRKVLAQYEGSSPCKLQINYGARQGLMRLPSGVEISEKLVEQLKTIVGSRGVLIN